MTMNPRRASRRYSSRPGGAVHRGSIASGGSGIARRRSSSAAALLASTLGMNLDDDDELDRDVCLYPTTTEKGMSAVTHKSNPSLGNPAVENTWGETSMPSVDLLKKDVPLFVSEDDLREKTQTLIMNDQLWDDFKKQLKTHKVHTGVGVKMVLHKFIIEKMSQQQDIPPTVNGEKLNLTPTALLEGLLGERGKVEGIGRAVRRKSGSALTAMFGNVDLSDEVSSATNNHVAAGKARANRTQSAYSRKSYISRNSDVSNKTITSAPAVVGRGALPQNSQIGDMPNRMVVVDHQQEQELQERKLSRRQSRGSGHFSQSSLSLAGSDMGDDASSIKASQHKSLQNLVASRSNSSNSMARAAAIVAAMDFDDVANISVNSEPDTDDDDDSIVYGIGECLVHNPEENDLECSNISCDFTSWESAPARRGSQDARILSEVNGYTADAGADINANGEAATAESASLSSNSSGAIAAGQRLRAVHANGADVNGLQQEQHKAKTIKSMNQNQMIIQGIEIDASQMGMGGSAGQCQKLNFSSVGDNDGNSSVGGLSSALSVGFLDDLLEEGSDIDSVSTDGEKEVNSEDDDDEDVDNKSFVNGLLFLAPTQGNSISNILSTVETEADDENIKSASGNAVAGLPSLDNIRQLKQALLQQDKPQELAEELMLKQQQEMAQQFSRELVEQQQRLSSSSVPSRPLQRSRGDNKGRKSYSHPLSSAANQRIATARCGWLPSDDDDDTENESIDSERSPQPRWFNIRKSSSSQGGNTGNCL